MKAAGVMRSYRRKLTRACRRHLSDFTV